MPRYWFTTHWPPLAHHSFEPLHIYIQDQFKNVARDLAPGDRVFVYEFKSGPKQLMRIDGQDVWVPRLLGKEGVVCEAEIYTALHERPGYVPEDFEDRSVKN